MITNFDKAFAPLLGGVVLFFLDKVGITGDMSVESAIGVGVSALISGVLVYLTPNK